MNFDQLKLLPGTSLQLEFHQSASEVREPSSLIGYQNDQCIIVSTPIYEGKPKEVQQGELVDVTLYSDELNCSVMFSVQVLTVISNPVAHAYLGFPAIIVKDESRKAQRVATNLIAKVKSQTGTQPAKIIDLSVSGCKLTSTDSIGPVDARLALVTKLMISGDECIVQLRGTIKGILAKPGIGGEVFEYGISFTDLSEATKASLHGFINSQSQ